MLKGYLEIYRYREVLYNFASQELKVKYKGSVLGFLWSLLNPLLTMSVTSVVFASILRFELNDFIVFVFTGLLPWGFIAGSLDSGANSIINAEGYIKKVYLPKMIFPLSSVISSFINMFFSMCALLVILVFIGYEPKVSLLFIPVSLLITIIMAIGFSLLLSTLTVFFRDMRYIINVLISTLFYLTAIIYPIEAVPHPYSLFIQWNPFYYFIMLFREPIYYGQLPSFENVMICIGIMLATLLLGTFVFKKYENKFVYKL